MLAANEAFYAAFEDRDLDAMSELWVHGGTVSCTHPGWRTLHGWPAVAGSWFALFDGPGALQFILTEVRAHVEHDLAWVHVDENLIGEGVGGTVAALNVFRRTASGWKLVVHHGSPVAERV